MSEPWQTSNSPPVDDVRVQLDRILASQALAGSDQLKRLLRVIVERAIGNQSDLLKEYNLGLEVFQRPPDYDPKVDPIVRVQARRLRAKLDEYYAGEGSRDCLVIHIPKGAYVPTFESRLATPAPDTRPARHHKRIWFAASATGILIAVFLVGRASRNSVAVLADEQRSIAVLPLQNYMNESNRSRIPDQSTELLTTELAKNKQFRVLSRTTASMYRDTSTSLPELARSLKVRWIVEGGLGSEGSRVYLKLRAVDSRTDRKVWADVYDCEVSELANVNARAAANIGAAIERQLLSEK